MSINFKLFEVKTQEANQIIFQAYVKDYNTYRITVDLTGRFKKKFLKIMSGDYTHKFICQDTEETGIYRLDEGQDAIKNLEQYARDCSSFTHATALLTESSISRQFVLHFKGSDYNMDKGMNPIAAKKANDFFYEVGKAMLTPISANNADYKKAEEFSTYEAASLRMEMYSSNNFTAFKEVFQKLLNDLRANQLSSSEAIGNGYQVYKKLLKAFKELAKFSNLRTLKVEIEGHDGATIRNFDAIRDLANETYGQDATGTFVIQSVNDYYRDSIYDGLIVDTRNFSKITTWKYESNDALSSFLHNQKGENVELVGITDGERLRSLNSLEFVRENFSFTDEEKSALENSGVTIINRKIIIS